MIIPKEQLKAEDVRQIVENIVKEHLPIGGDGYKCSQEQVSAVLIKAAVEGQTIESTCADLELAVDSNTIRAHLNQAFEVVALRRDELEMNNGLVAGVPPEMPQRGCAMALDCHDEPFYGHTPELRSYACHRQAKEGTTHFYRLATLYVMWRQVRITLALTYVLPEDSTLAVVTRLLERMGHLHYKPSVLYLDKGFCQGEIISYLHRLNVPAVMACPIRGKPGKGGIRALCRGRCSYCTNYTFTDGTVARLALVATLVPDKTGKKRRKWLAFVLVHLDWSAKKTSQWYRRRFGIESTYRQLARLRIRTTTRNPALRFFVLGFGFLLLNVWARLRLLVARVIAVGPTRLTPTAFRLPRFCAFLRRAIEKRFGTPDSIPIYSW